VKIFKQKSVVIFLFATLCVNYKEMCCGIKYIRLEKRISTKKSE